MGVHVVAKGVVVSGMVKLAGWLTFFCILAFDAGGIVTNRILLDEAARVAAGQAADAARNANTYPLGAAHEAATASLSDQKGIELLEISFVEGRVVVKAKRRARVVVASRISALDDQVTVEVTASAAIQQ